MRINTKAFQELTVDELYALLKLRFDVFVLEQTCFYNELDCQDQTAHHILAEKDGQLIGYARILFEKQHLHIGRIVIKENYRKLGLGKQIITNAMQFCNKQFPGEDIYLSAQAHLAHYYEKFGYRVISKPYDWDGIVHIDMKYDSKKILKK